MARGKVHITADDLSDAVVDVLNGFADDVASAVTDAVMMTAEQTVKIVKEKSPKKTGKYRKGWKIKKVKGGYFDRVASATIHNKDEYRRTHLLEYGHQKADGGRVEGTPHIRTAEQAAIRLLPELIQREIEEAGK